MRDYRGLTKAGKWVHGWYWYNEATGKHYIRATNFQPAEFDYTDYEVIPESIGQSTGRTVKDKELYAGDIVNLKHGTRGNLHKNLIITWDDCRFYAKESWSVCSGYSLDTEFIEIIGNVTQNPELVSDNSQ
jgi:hypothetical protein